LAALWSYEGGLMVVLKAIGRTTEPFRSLLAAVGRVMGGSWEPFGSHLGATWRHFGGTLELLWRYFGVQRAFLKGCIEILKNLQICCKVLQK